MTDPVVEMTQLLSEPVTIGGIAGATGLDLMDIEKAMALDDDSAECRESEKEQRVLEGIRQRVQTARTANKDSANIFKITISQLPSKLLTEDKRRLPVLL